MTAISAKNLVKRYGKFEALGGVSFDVMEGESFCLLGPNGAGKTTTIGILTGNLLPTSGSAEVMGVDVTKDSLEVKRRIGIVPEMEYPPSFLTVKEYLDMVCSIRKVKEPEPKVKSWIEFFGLTEKEDSLCKDLSKGTKKKVMLSAALVHEPKLLFLDEPFLDLDPIVQKDVREYLKSYTKEGGTIFLSTHILEIAEKLCDRTAILQNGHMVASGSITELRIAKESLEDVFMRLVKEEAR